MERKIHWQKWSKLCRSKVDGGMGFRDLLGFNQSLLAKQRLAPTAANKLLTIQSFKSQVFSNMFFHGSCCTKSLIVCMEEYCAG
jgi:hypothetical protein